VITDKPEHTDRVVTVRGLEIYTRRRPGPASPPLLLVNGLGGSLTSWQPLLDQLPARDVVMVDTPGAGRSQTPRLPLPVRVLADIVAEATRALGIEKADVLGFSHGGTVVQEIAKRQPALVRRVVLVGTMFGFGARPVPARAHRRLLSTKRYRDRATAERDFPLLAGGRTARDPEVLAELLDTRESHPPTPRGYYYQQLALAGWSSWLWLKRLPYPTLVLHGAADPVVPQVNARLLASRIPNAELEIIDGAGHLLLFDDSSTVAPVIERFLDR
jgi:pimeloyl-ACP methyl ester carboxylesterase